VLDRFHLTFDSTSNWGPPSSQVAAIQSNWVFGFWLFPLLQNVTESYLQLCLNLKANTIYFWGLPEEGEVITFIWDGERTGACIFMAFWRLRCRCGCRLDASVTATKKASGFFLLLHSAFFDRWTGDVWGSGKWFRRVARKLQLVIKIVCQFDLWR